MTTTGVKYVDRDNDTVYRAPYEQANTFLTAWLVPSSRAAQQKILDDHQNVPSGAVVAEYRALLTHAMFVFANISQVSSLDPRDSQRGWIPEVDICFWILAGVYVTPKGGGEKVLDRIVWYVPYIWVNNAYTMATGREAFGYPKALGWAQLPKDQHDPGPLWADALVIPTFTPTTEVVRKRVITLQRDANAKAPPTPPETFDDKAKALEAIGRRIAQVGEAACDWDLVKNLIEDALGGHLPMVFLKQFRDCMDPQGACYQAIIEANATVNGFEGAGILPPGWQFQIEQYASVDMPTHLEIAPQQKVDFGFWVKFSFSMDLGTEIWRAT